MGTRRIYGRLLSDLVALLTATLPPGPLESDGLAALDQFHSRGLKATEELADLAAPAPGQSWLDLGCGLGGPARWLAQHRGVEVTGLDLDPTHIAAARYLSARCGLGDRLRFVVGDAAQPDFPAADFDGIWLQHIGANIAEKGAFAASLARLLQPGGRLALHEVFAGAAMLQPDFPLPWASRPEESFLEPWPAFRARLEHLGFRCAAAQDLSASTAQWLTKQRDRPLPQLSNAPALGIATVLGPTARQRIENLRLGLERGALAIMMALWQAPS